MFENYRTFETTYAGRPIVVETGKTLLENNLSPRETIVDISARLISNKASYSFKTQKIDLIKAELQKQVQVND